MIELLVVLLLVALLSMVMLPGLAGVRTNSKVSQCMNNLRRLTGAWLMYTVDNADAMPLQLAGGILDWTANPDNTNAAILVNPAQSAVARYVRQADLFKCPADEYKSAANPGLRVRSVSGNAVLGNGIQPANVFNQIPGRTYVAKFTKLTTLNKPGPGNTIALLDEHPDSIDDALFIFSVGRSAGNAQFVNFPGNHHGGGGTLSFVDGHVVLKRWQDVRTCPPVKYIQQVNVATPANVDYTWINDRMPYQ